MYTDNNNGIWGSSKISGLDGLRYGFKKKPEGLKQADFHRICLFYFFQGMCSWEQ
jgi:hypothetical protein